MFDAFFASADTLGCCEIRLVHVLSDSICTSGESEYLRF